MWGSDSRKYGKMPVGAEETWPPLGERQHKAIAKRLYQQYPHIFRDSANISARSSVSVRCIMSMSAFTEQLKELTPLPPDHPRSQPKTHGLHCLYFTRSRKAGFGKCAMENSFPYIRRKSYSSGTFNHFTFQKSQRSQESPRAHDGTLLDCFRHARCRVAVYPFYDLFEKEELFGIWQSVNYRMYICNANAPVNQGAAPESAKSLLKNIIESADRAIREGTPLRHPPFSDMIPTWSVCWHSCK